MKVLASTLAVIAGLAAGPLAAQPLDTAFTYQGRLQDAGAPANGPYDFRFILFDAPVGGSQIGPIVFRDDIVLADGLFTVSLDFGTSAFTGSKRWLDIAIRPGASGGTYTALSERQELQSAPHSAFSLRSPWTGIAGKPAGFADDTDNDALGGLACANGQLARWNGTAWACAADVDTTYSAGAGLDLTATTFSLADLGVTTPKVANNAITTPKLTDGAVTSAKIADGAVALADLGQNGCTSTQLLKWNGTAWACAADLDTNSGGTVTSVGTGAGLTGGPITTAGTVAVAPGGITSTLLADGAVTAPKIAAGAVGLAQINTAEVQARITTTCPPGQYLKGINANGAVVCGQMPFVPNYITTLDDAVGTTGTRTSIAIGTDGLPVISFFDTLGRVKVAHCGNPACVPPPGNIIANVELMSGTGGPTSIAIGSDGFPVISLYVLAQAPPNPALTFLRVVKCLDRTCTAIPTVSNFPLESGLGLYTSVAIGNDGFPVICYHNPAAGTLKVVDCDNAACTPGASSVATVDNNSTVGAHCSIAIGADGFPIISYHDGLNGNLKVAKCGNAACSSTPILTTVDSHANNVGLYTSIAIDTDDGLPVISYHDATAGRLKVAKCGNAACSTPDPTITEIEGGPGNFAGTFTSVDIGPDGLPVISYHNGTAGSLKVVRCGNPACSASNTITTVDDNNVGSHTSIAISADGLPVISYHDGNAGSLKVAKCSTPSCR